MDKLRIGVVDGIFAKSICLFLVLINLLIGLFACAASYLQASVYISWSTDFWSEAKLQVIVNVTCGLLLIFGSIGLYSGRKIFKLLILISLAVLIMSVYQEYLEVLLQIEKPTWRDKYSSLVLMYWALFCALLVPHIQRSRTAIS
jgi:intracellular septation protein A